MQKRIFAVPVLFSVLIVILLASILGCSPDSDPVKPKAPTLKSIGNQTVPLGSSLSFQMEASDGVLSSAETANISVPGAKGVTDLSGRLLDVYEFVATKDESSFSKIPIDGATVSLLDSGLSAVTDKDVFFIIDEIPDDAPRILDLDSSTTVLGANNKAYAGFREKISLIDGVTNVVDHPFYLPQIDASNLTQVDPNNMAEVINPNLNMALIVLTNIAKNSDGTNFTDSLLISEAPEGLASVPMPAEFQSGLLLTIKLVGVTFSRPDKVSFTNKEPANNFNKKAKIALGIYYDDEKYT